MVFVSAPLRPFATQAEPLVSAPARVGAATGARAERPE